MRPTSSSFEAVDDALESGLSTAGLSRRSRDLSRKYRNRRASGLRGIGGRFALADPIQSDAPLLPF
jgi:hypothetical protein